MRDTEARQPEVGVARYGGPVGDRRVGTASSPVRRRGHLGSVGGSQGRGAAGVGRGRPCARNVTCAPPGARGRRRPSSAARRPPLRAPRTFALRLGPPLRLPRCRGRPRHVRRGGPGSAAPPRPLRGAPARLTPPASASGGRRPARATAQARPGRERGARCYVTARGVAFRKGRRFTIAEGVVLRCGTWLYDPVGRVTEEGPGLYDDQGCGWEESAELYDTVGAWPEGGRGTLAPRWGRGLFTTGWGVAWRGAGLRHTAA